MEIPAESVEDDWIQTEVICFPFKVLLEGVEGEQEMAAVPGR